MEQLNVYEHIQSSGGQWLHFVWLEVSVWVYYLREGFPEYVDNIVF